MSLDPREVVVPVVGGHAGVTILPLLYQVKPPCSFTQKEIEYLTDCIQNGGGEVFDAKAGAGLPSSEVCRCLPQGSTRQCKHCREDVGSMKCTVGPLNEYERMGLEKAKKELEGSITKGVTFVKK
ncbi:hypothetical protein Bca4012_085258 [Brassica carinata]